MGSEELFDKAIHVIPGGVNSPVRAYGSVGMTPRFIKSANKSKIYDVDGREYIDYICSWGPMILGHNHPAVRESVIKATENGLSFGAATEKEVEMAELICSAIPSIDMIRMVNSGTEAVMSAIRAARGFTHKNKIIKFEGCYHGHSDSMLVKAGSGVMTAGVPGSAGVPVGCTEDTLTAIYNDLNSVENIIQANQGEIAAVIVEAVGANMGVVLPEEGFLSGLRKICTKENIVLIFDEVITGFRLGFTGAQGYFKIEPDLTTFGKIIGAGMPVGAYGGKREIMENVSPVGCVYQAGTLSGNPIAMTAGLTLLRLLSNNKEIYQVLNNAGDVLFNGIEKILKEAGLTYTVNHVGSLGSIFFTDRKVTNYSDALSCNTESYAMYFKKMLQNGCHIAPSQFEAMFLSTAHTQEDLEQTLEAVRKSIC